MFLPALTFDNIILYLIYGLAFIVMGLAILLQRNKSSDMRLARNLHYLAAFGICHGLAEWMYFIIPLRLNFFPQADVVLMLGTLFFLKVASYVFLLHFGLSLYCQTRSFSPWLKGLPSLLLLIWFLGFSLNLSVDKFDLRTWKLAEVWSRYLLALPGSLITGYALILQGPDFVEKGMPSSLRTNLYCLAGTMFGYSLFGGLIVPKAEFFPASVLNTRLFFDLTYIPIQIVRAVCGLLFAVFTIRITAFYDLEAKRIIQDAQKRQAVLEERERIARDLHDGIIQDIYGEGLHLEQMVSNLKKSQRKVGCELQRTIGRLNEIIWDIRNYISGLATPSPGSSLRQVLEKMVGELTERTNLSISLQIGDNVPQLAEETVHNIGLILRESLHNAIRHAGADTLTVICDKRGNKLYLSVIDNGVGFGGSYSGTGHGIANMKKRAVCLNGEITIMGYPGRGTEVSLFIPLEDG